MKLENQNILIISNEPWCDIWYSKHNYANELSKNNKVFFLNPPNSFSFKNIFKGIEEKVIHPNLTVIEYSNVLPVSLLGFWKPNDKFVLRRLKNYFTGKNLHDILFWTFDPIRLAFPEILEPKKIIIHAVDDYLFSFPAEEILAKKADCVFCVSETITSSYKKHNFKSYTIPHAIPDEEFLSLSDQKLNPRSAIFIGKMDDRIDFEFNFTIFKSFPDIKFTIIGFVNDGFIKILKKSTLSNVTLLPPMASKELKHFIQAADFCFIFKKIFSGNNIFSHKLLQYLAQGKPIFGTKFSDFPTEIQNILYLSNNINEMKQMIENFYKNGESPVKAETRANYARLHTFSKTLLNIERLLN